MVVAEEPVSEMHLKFVMNILRHIFGNSGVWHEIQELHPVECERYWKNSSNTNLFMEIPFQDSLQQLKL